jgi:hypothetical protein
VRLTVIHTHIKLCFSESIPPPNHYAEMSNETSFNYNERNSIIPYGFSFDYGMVNDPSLKELCAYYRQLSETSKKVKIESTAKKKTIANIPMDCVLLIFDFMDARSLCASQSVCQLWREPTTNEDYWRHLCVAVFSSSPESFVFKKEVSIKSVYAAMHATVVDLFYGRSHAVSTNNFVIPRASVPMFANY